jgi:hypothetical protein
VNTLEKDKRATSRGADRLKDEILGEDWDTVEDRETAQALIFRLYRLRLRIDKPPGECAGAQEPSGRQNG